MDLTLNNGDVVSSSFDRSCAAYGTDEEFLPAFTSLVERLSDKKLNSHFPFKLERPLVQSVQDVSGRNLAELADEFYKEGKLTSFNAIFPELDTETRGSLCEKIYTEGRISRFLQILHGTSLAQKYPFMRKERLMMGRTPFSANYCRICRQKRLKITRRMPTRPIA